MTIDAKTKALLEALDAYMNPHPASENRTRELAVLAARAAFEPEPEMVYTMPEWKEISGNKNAHEIWLHHPLPNTTTITHLAYNALRELTRHPKMEGREWWIFDGAAYGQDGPQRIHVREVLP